MSIALIPIRANGEIVGLLQLNARRKNCFTFKMIQCFEEIGMNIGLALMRKQAEEMLREAGERSKMFLQRILAVREEEKKKLSANLHDELGTMAVALNADLSVIQSDLEKKNYKNVVKNIRKTKIILKKEIAIFRKIVEELRPPNLDVIGLAGVLKEKFSKRAEESGLDISFKIGNRDNILGDEIATAVYRVTQEAFTNIVKHAKARKVDVSLHYWRTQLKYTICDDGCGFDVNHVLKNSKVFKLGIQGMRERIEALGGTFIIESVMKKGTSILITIPVSRGEGGGGLKNEHNSYYS
ncbi:MAG: GAF domain-containing sensor histidine kinase [Candidatus Omnitrophica bacterium]|nr:GAF domain-containing sensor histidine kinase [Candidatus Omnitrophota bacterium]